jgi:hypothetical protein
MADPSTTFREEVAIVRAAIVHPAGFDLDIFGGVLCIRSAGGPMNTEEMGIEVEWNTVVGAKPDVGVRRFTREQPDEAATFFVQKRHELRMGLDFEEIDARAHLRRESPR